MKVSVLSFVEPGRSTEYWSVWLHQAALMLLLARVERLSENALYEKDKLLKEQFLENLRDPQLRRDIKRWVRDHPTKTFQQVREEVQCWLNEEGIPQRRVAAREVMADHPPYEESTCKEVTGGVNLKNILDELVAGQKILADNLLQQHKLLTERLENQQAALDRHQQDISRLLAASGSQQRWQPGCFGCGSRNHLKRNCPRNQPSQRGGGNNGNKNKLPALNEKTPRQ